MIGAKMVEALARHGKILASDSKSRTAFLANTIVLSRYCWRYPCNQ